jgi:hypothetical protein
VYFVGCLTSSYAYRDKKVVGVFVRFYYATSPEQVAILDAGNDTTLMVAPRLTAIATLTIKFYIKTTGQR